MIVLLAVGSVVVLIKGDVPQLSVALRAGEVFRMPHPLHRVNDFTKYGLVTCSTCALYNIKHVITTHYNIQYRYRYNKTCSLLSKLSRIIKNEL